MKRRLSLLLTGLLCMSVLCGCAKQENEQQTLPAQVIQESQKQKASALPKESQASEEQQHSEAPQPPEESQTPEKPQPSEAAENKDVHMRHTINTIGDDNELTSFGSSKPSEDALSQLESSIEAMTNEGYDVSLVMYDLNTDSGVSFCSDRIMCTQSTIKAVYLCALLEENPGLLEKHHTEIEKAVRLSDNEAYEYLRSLYGSEPIERWCRETGVEHDMSTRAYPCVTVKDMCLLWTKMYTYLESGSAPEELKTYLSDSACSSAREVLGGLCRVQSKAGWESGLGTGSYYSPERSSPSGYTDKNPYNDECAINDTGIVFTDRGAYLFAIFTDHSFDVFENYTPPNPLNGITKALFQVQQSL